MSISPHRVQWFRTVDVCVSVALLSSLGCHRARSLEPQPTAAESSAQALPMSDEGRAPRFAGVAIVPASKLGFLVRIQSAMVGSGDPLYVIDGVRMNIPPNRGIDWFKPEDIVDIKVLKQPHELAEYGPAGVNGVIVIATKMALRRSPQR